MHATKKVFNLKTVYDTTKLSVGHYWEIVVYESVSDVISGLLHCHRLKLDFVLSSRYGAKLVDC